MLRKSIVINKIFNSYSKKANQEYLLLMKNLVVQGKAQDRIKPGDIKYFVPRSAEMIALVSRINKND